MAALGEAAQRELQAMARSGNYEFASDFAKKYVMKGKPEGLAEGEAKGRAEGRAAGRAEALLRVLAHRNFPVDELLRDRIMRATIEQLDEWLVRAVDANAVTDVFKDG